MRLPKLGDWVVSGVHCPPSSDSEFGNLKSGSFIDIKGPLVSVQLLPLELGIFARHQPPYLHVIMTMRPVGAKQGSSAPQVYIDWDSDDRIPMLANEQVMEARISFFIVTGRTGLPAGLPLKEASPGSRLECTISSQPKSSHTPAVTIPCYERIASIRSVLVEPRRRAWSDDNSDSDYDGRVDTWEFWQEFVRDGIFRIY
jgi:hypothetical protein